VAVTKLDEMGERVHLAERGPGEALGEMSLLDGSPRSSDVSTLEESDFLILDRGSFVHALAGSPEMAMAIIAKLCARLRQADAERTQHRPVRERLAQLIYQAAKQRRLEMDGKAGPIMLNLPRKELAERVRASRETVSREISTMVAAGVLELDGRAIVVKNAGALKRLFNAG
jgi:CRP-like cAMP-binding protein